MVSNKIARNMAWLFMSQMSTWLVSIAMLVIVPRLISDSQFGRTEFAFTFVSFFTLAAQMGTSTFIIKSTARDATLMVPYTVNALAMKAVLAVLMSAGAVGLAALVGYGSEEVALVAICCIGLASSVLNDTVVAALHGRQDMKRPAAWAAVQGYLSSAVSLAVLIWTDSLTLYMLALVSAGVIPLFANLKHVWPELRDSIHIDLRLWRTLALGGAPFLIWGAVQLVYGKIDIPLLESLAGSSAVGWYSLAYNWVSLPVFIAAIVSTAFFPALSETGVSSKPHFQQLGNQALRIVMFMGLPAATGIALVAEDVFAALHYSDNYRHAIVIMRVLALHVPIIIMDMMLGLMIIAVDRQRQWIIVGCVAVVANPLLNLVAIPFTVRHFHNGAIGAAVVTVITELVMMVGAIVLRPAHILDRPTTGFILRCTAACVAMAPAVLALRDEWLIVRALVGATIYLAVSMLLKTFSPRTWRRDFLPPRELATVSVDDRVRADDFP